MHSSDSRDPRGNHSRYEVLWCWILIDINVDFIRFTRDARGESIVMGDYQFPDEPNGRVVLFGRFCTFTFSLLLSNYTNSSFSSPWVVNWIRQRAEEGLSTISRIGIDATFKVSPGNWAQVLILHAHIGGKQSCCLIVFIIFSPDTFWAPLYYCLMPWRSEEVYAKAYELIDEASTFPWPDDLNVMMDFELWVIFSVTVLIFKFSTLR